MVSNLTPAVAVLAIFVLLIVRRAVRLVRGARYSPGRWFAVTGLSLFLFGLFGFSTLSAAAALWGPAAWALASVYGGVVLGTALVARPYVRRIVRFESRGPGIWFYRLPWLVPGLYLVLFLVRLSAAIVIFGVSAATSFVVTALPESLVLVLLAIDLLFGASVGLLTGRAIGVSEAFPPIAGSATGSSAPLPDGADTGTGRDRPRR